MTAADSRLLDAIASTSPAGARIRIGTLTGGTTAADGSTLFIIDGIPMRALAAATPAVLNARWVYLADGDTFVALGPLA